MIYIILIAYAIIYLPDTAVPTILGPVPTQTQRAKGDSTILSQRASISGVESSSNRNRNRNRNNNGKETKATPVTIFIIYRI